MPATRLTVSTACLQVWLLVALGSALLLALPSEDRDPRTAGRLSLGLGVPSAQSFPKWTGMVRRVWARDEAWSEVCADRLGRPCGLRSWQAFLEGLRSETRWDQLSRVNRFVNAFRYRADRSNWGASDYWAAPGEFFSVGGDCEDFAIAKYFSLKALGFPVERMRIVVLNDLVRRLPHAVLAVDVGPYALVLDSLDDEIRLWSELPHYRPIYTINEKSYAIATGRRIT